MGKVVLISTYELGRQPFGLASPAAWLRAAGAEVVTQDLSVCDLDQAAVRDACLVGVYLPMHTATRLAEPVLTRIRDLNPSAHLCAYGLYAPMNADHLRSLGATSIVGGEFERTLVALYLETVSPPSVESLRPQVAAPTEGVVLDRLDFLVPDRSDMPDPRRYAHLTLGGRDCVVGYTEATRGCKHMCRHCPIVPVYGGVFRVVQEDVVLADIAQQVARGVEHITFGDPDFLNGPAHAMRVVRRLGTEFPGLTYDVTIKVEHLRRHANLLAELAATGCVLVTSAVESFDEAILERFDKRHTPLDLEVALRALDEVGISLNPTFVAFTPWTTISGYGDLLAAVRRLDLVRNVSPVQYGIRLLVPAGSHLLELSEMADLLDEFDPATLAFGWRSPDPRVDELQQRVAELVAAAHDPAVDRVEVFRQIWQATATLSDSGLAALPDQLEHPRGSSRADVPQMSEPWYCCAEPTAEQYSVV